MKRYKNYNLSKEVSLVSIFTAFAILFGILSNFIVLPFAPWLTIDFSPIFIFGIYLFVERRSIIYTTISILVVSLLNFINMGVAGWVGVIISFCSNAIYVFILIVLTNLLKRFFKSNRALFGLVLTIGFLLASLSLTVLNGLFFTPLYWWLFIDSSMISFLDWEKWYNANPNLWLLYIPHYWAGIFGLYISFNIIKFGICSFLIFSLVPAFNKKITVGIECKKTKILYI